MSMLMGTALLLMGLSKLMGLALLLIGSALLLLGSGGEDNSTISMGELWAGALG